MGTTNSIIPLTMTFNGMCSIGKRQNFSYFQIYVGYYYLFQVGNSTQFKMDNLYIYMLLLTLKVND